MYTSDFYKVLFLFIIDILQYFPKHFFNNYYSFKCLAIFLVKIAIFLVCIEHSNK